MRSSAILDRFSNWICGQMWIWGWAEKRGSCLAVRVCRLCMARGVGVSIRWAHLVGKLDLNDALAASALEKVTAWQKVAIGVMGSADVEAVMPLDRTTDRWVVPVPDWFFNGTADAPSEAADAPPVEPDEQVQIGPLDV